CLSSGRRNCLLFLIAAGLSNGGTSRSSYYDDRAGCIGNHSQRDAAQDKEADSLASVRSDNNHVCFPGAGGGDYSLNRPPLHHYFFYWASRHSLSHGLRDIACHLVGKASTIFEKLAQGLRNGKLAFRRSPFDYVQDSEGGALRPFVVAHKVSYRCAELF